MIRNISHKTLMLAFILLVIGTVGGWATVWKVAGGEASMSFLKMGAWIALTFLSIQSAVFLCMRNRIFLQLLFLASCGLSLVWFMFSLFVPVLWMENITAGVKVTLITIFLLLCYCNVVKAFIVFEGRWIGLGEDVRGKRLGRQGEFINWDKLIVSMRLESSLYIPGLSERIAMVAFVTMLISMVVALNFRNAFPIFSAFACGVPSALLVSFFFQMIGFNLAQARKVRLLERECGVLLKQIV